MQKKKKKKKKKKKSALIAILWQSVCIFYPFNRDICDGSSLRTENDHLNLSFLFHYEVFEFMFVGVFFVLKMTILMMIPWLWVCAFCAFVQLRRLSLLSSYLLHF